MAMISLQDKSRRVAAPAGVEDVNTISMLCDCIWFTAFGLNFVRELQRRAVYIKALDFATPCIYSQE
jgi:hypothetical protein